MGNQESLKAKSITCIDELNDAVCGLEIIVNECINNNTDILEKLKNIISNETYDEYLLECYKDLNKYNNLSNIEKINKIQEIMEYNRKINKESIKKAEEYLN